MTSGELWTIAGIILYLLIGMNLWDLIGGNQVVAKHGPVVKIALRMFLTLFWLVMLAVLTLRGKNQKDL